MAAPITVGGTAVRLSRVAFEPVWLTR